MRGGQAPYGAICAYKRCVTTLNDAADEEMSQHSEQKTRKYAPTPATPRKLQSFAKALKYTKHCPIDISQTNEVIT